MFNLLKFFRRKKIDPVFLTAKDARKLMHKTDNPLDNAIRNIQLRAIVGQSDALIQVRFDTKELVVEELKKLGYNVPEKQVLDGYIAISW